MMIEIEKASREKRKSRPLSTAAERLNEARLSRISARMSKSGRVTSVYNNFNFEDVKQKITEYDKAKARADSSDAWKWSTSKRNTKAEDHSKELDVAGSKFDESGGKKKKTVTIRPPSVYDNFDFRDIHDRKLISTTE